jgi:hypothetical protein
LNGTRFGPANGNGNWFYSGFCGTRRFDITCVERKDGGWRFLDGSDSLLGFETDGRCNGVELFRGGKFVGLISGCLLFIALWKRSVKGSEILKGRSWIVTMKKALRGQKHETTKDGKWD